MNIRNRMVSEVVSNVLRICGESGFNSQALAKLRPQVVDNVARWDNATLVAYYSNLNIKRSAYHG